MDTFASTYNLIQVEIIVGKEDDFMTQVIISDSQEITNETRQNMCSHK